MRISVGKKRYLRAGHGVVIPPVEGAGKSDAQDKFRTRLLGPELRSCACMTPCRLPQQVNFAAPKTAKSFLLSRFA